MGMTKLTVSLDDESKKSFEHYYSLLNMEYPDFEKDREDWRNAMTEEEKTSIGKRFSDWLDEQDKSISEAIRNLIPRVGLGCTIVLYSDRRAATVTHVLSPSKIEVMENDYECIDYYAGKYKVLLTIAEYMGKTIFTKRRNGLWVKEGQKSKDGVRLALNYQRTFIDPSF